jgi:hypothetical protein
VSKVDRAGCVFVLRNDVPGFVEHAFSWICVFSAIWGSQRPSPNWRLPNCDLCFYTGEVCVFSRDLGSALAFTKLGSGSPPDNFQILLSCTRRARFTWLYIDLYCCVWATGGSVGRVRRADREDRANGQIERVGRRNGWGAGRSGQKRKLQKKTRLIT